jgi:predicted secreted hydrolase
VPSRNLTLSVSAAQDDQEVKSRKISQIDYYEGAVRVSGESNGKSVSGQGYLEITGAKGQKTNGGRGMGGVL